MDIGYVDKPDMLGKPDRFFNVKNTSLQDIYDMVGTPKELQDKLMELTKGHPSLKNALFSMPVHEQGRNFIANNILGGMMNDAIAGNNGKDSVKQKVNGFFTELYDMYKPGSSIPISQKSLHSFADRIYSESFQGKAKDITGIQRYEYYQQHGIPKLNATTSSSTASKNTGDILGGETANMNETNPATGNRVPIWQNDKFSREEQIAAYTSKPNYFAEDFGITNEDFNKTFSSMDEKNRKRFIENIYSDIADDKTGEEIVDQINKGKKWSKTKIKNFGNKYQVQAQAQGTSEGKGTASNPKINTEKQVKDAEWYVLHPHENPNAPAYNPEALTPEQRKILEDYEERLDRTFGGKTEIPETDGITETAIKGENIAMTNDQRAHLKNKFGLDPDNIKLGEVIPKNYELDNAVELKAKYREPLKSSSHGKAALAVGTAVTAGALVLGLSSSRGQQSNAQLYGQQPLSY